MLRGSTYLCAPYQYRDWVSRRLRLQRCYRWPQNMAHHWTVYCVLSFWHTYTHVQPALHAARTSNSARVRELGRLLCPRLFSTSRNNTSVSSIVRILVASRVVDGCVWIDSWQPGFAFLSKRGNDAQTNARTTSCHPCMGTVRKIGRVSQ